MRNRDIAQLQSSVQEFAEIKEQLENSIYSFLGHLKDIERQYDREFSATHILEVTRTIVEDIDVDKIFEFVDDLEAEIGNLSYNYKRAVAANQMATYPKPYSPAFYKPLIEGERNL